MSNRLSTVLAVVALVVAAFAIARPAGAQVAPVAICTPVVVLSADPVTANLALEGVINDHLAHGRTNVLVQAMPPAPGPYVCAW